MIFTSFYVTYISIFTSDTSSIFYKTPSTAYGTLCYYVFLLLNTSEDSVNYLAPLHFRRKKAYLDQFAVTRYLKDGCFQAYFLAVLAFSLSSTLSSYFGTLSVSLGCFPLDYGYYHP